MQLDRRGKLQKKHGYKDGNEAKTCYHFVFFGCIKYVQYHMYLLGLYNIDVRVHVPFINLLFITLVDHWKHSEESRATLWHAEGGTADPAQCTEILYILITSIYKSLAKSIKLCLSVSQPVGLSICLFVCLSAFLPLCVFAYLSVCLFICRSLCLFVRRSVHLSVSLSACLFVSLSVF